MVRTMQVWVGSVFLFLFLLGPVADVFPEDKITNIKWEKYDTDSNGVQYFYDRGSISYASPNVLQVRRQRIFPQEAQYTRVITLDQIDCTEQRYRTMEITVTNKDGSTQEFKKASRWAYIHLGMPEGYFLREHCE